MGYRYQRNRRCYASILSNVIIDLEGGELIVGRKYNDSVDPLRVFNLADDCEHIYRYAVKRLKDDKSDKYG